jgi:diacylglycerol kinase (ATP)
MSSRYLFVVNPISGAGKGKIVARLLGELLPKHPAFRDGSGVVFLTTDQSTPAFLESLSQARAAISVGGDGTASRLIPQILRCEPSPALGLIPLGTSNDLARAMGVSVENDYTEKSILQATLDGLADSKEEKLDIFCVNQRVFFCNYLGLGFDAAIVRDFDRARGLKFMKMVPHGRLTNNFLYFLMGLKNVGFRLEPGIGIEYEDDNGNHHMTIDSRCLGISITNLPVYAGGCRICPDARKDDGMFEITVVHGLGQFIKLILTRFLPFIQTPAWGNQYRAKRATIHLKTVSPCQIDGERCQEPEIMTPAFKIAFHSRLRFLTPRKPSL